MHKDYWRSVAGTLFALGFIALVVALIVSAGNQTALTAVIIVLIGAMILIAVLPKVQGFTIGPQGVVAKLGQLETAVREQSQQVQTLSDHVKKLEEHIVFEQTPLLTPNLEQDLNSALQSFSHYLQGLGFMPQGAEITVRIDEPSDGSYSYFDDALDKIALTRDFAVDSDAALREYTHHVLLSLVGSVDERGLALTELLSGLAYYYPCSYNNRLCFAPILAKTLGRQCLVDLSTPRKFTRMRTSVTFSSELQGDIWAAAFWEMRQLFGQQPTDTLLFNAWSALQPTDLHKSRLELARRLIQIAPSYASEEQVRQILRIFEQRGLKL